MVSIISICGQGLTKIRGFQLIIKILGFKYKLLKCLKIKTTEKFILNRLFFKRFKLLNDQFKKFGSQNRPCEFENEQKKILYRFL